MRNHTILRRLTPVLVLLLAACAAPPPPPPPTPVPTSTPNVGHLVQRAPNAWAWIDPQGLQVWEITEVTDLVLTVRADTVDELRLAEGYLHARGCALVDDEGVWTGRAFTGDRKLTLVAPCGFAPGAQGS